MKALVCNSYGLPENLTFKEVDIPQINPNEVLIRIKAAGLNFPDTLTIQGKDQYGLSLPFIPGREYAGIIEKVGSNISQFKVGDRVMAEGMTGALAQFVSAPETKVFRIPDSMSYEDASVFQVTYGTAYHALVDRGTLNTKDHVVILGASGGVGSAVIEISKCLGAQITACCSTEEKLSFCKSLGADHGILYNTENLKLQLKEISDGKGVDVVCDMVGGEFTEQAFRALAWNGRHLIIGFTAGSIPKLPLNLPLLKGASVIGVFWSTFCKKFPKKFRSNTEILLNWYEQGKLKPEIFKTYDFNQSPEAFHDFLNRKIIGKVCITIDQ